MSSLFQILTLARPSVVRVQGFPGEAVIGVYKSIAPPQGSYDVTAAKAFSCHYTPARADIIEAHSRLSRSIHITLNCLDDDRLCRGRFQQCCLFAALPSYILP
jgi:hypothetical protein